MQYMRSAKIKAQGRARQGKADQDKCGKGWQKTRSIIPSRVGYCKQGFDLLHLNKLEHKDEALLLNGTSSLLVAQRPSNVHCMAVLDSSMSVRLRIMPGRRSIG